MLDNTAQRQSFKNLTVGFFVATTVCSRFCGQYNLLLVISNMKSDHHLIMVLNHGTGAKTN
ncbi:hypothetical protein DERP_011058 [Dermatophagoides pteronyssinus]|uniref:Uncharacterized protein n=1 Tax=Dermatophagoides pteronyssinus TaxID=6956 RepID=A0ABQ8J949_DERPT|nr:hypothetical protein DERP_011058 [Dermatophagoides pteronyssinus]